MTPYKAIIEGREREIVGWTEKGTLLLTDGEIALTAVGVTLKGKVWRIARLKFENGQWWVDGQTLSDALFLRPDVDSTKLDRALQKFVAENPDATTDEFMGAISDADDKLAGFTHVGTITHLICLLTHSKPLPESEKQVLRDNVVAVAWLEDYFRQDDFVKIPPLTAPIENPRRPTEVDKTLEELEDLMRKAGIEPSPAIDPTPQPKRYLPIFLTRCDFIVSPQNLPLRDENRPEWFTDYASAAKYAKVSEKTIRNWKKRGWLPVEQVGRKIRIARSDLDKCRNRQ